ncbi:MAG: hypothetical protein JSS59_01605 [Proteobacteria bacterium]|uniref:hypothetical protein n=1 Tax=Rudaea sp. TaxID=2136325 RepID=UPI003783D5F6|nr:hypothetical protein [Pseudomonadota bacterium]
MLGKVEFVAAVDAFMLAQKTLAGVDAPLTWQRARDDDARRVKIPIQVDGEQHDQYLLIDAFPEHESLKFCVAIMFSEYVVCRLDFDLEVVHGNNHSHELPLLVVGPHWHSWELNRTTIELGHRFHLPNALEFHEARQFDATLRWYCAQRHIALGAHKIELPHAERLL